MASGTPLSLTDEHQADLLLAQKLKALINEPFTGISLAGDDPARLLNWRAERDRLAAALRDAAAAVRGIGELHIWQQTLDEWDALLKEIG